MPRKSIHAKASATEEQKKNPKVPQMIAGVMKDLFPHAPDAGKRVRRFKPGTVALKEIKKYQKTTNFTIPRASFESLARRISCQHGDNLKFQPKALEALQEAAEAHLVDLLSKSNLCAIHAKRETVMPSDMRLVVEIREDNANDRRRKISSTMISEEFAFGYRMLNPYAKRGENQTQPMYLETARDFENRVLGNPARTKEDIDMIVSLKFGEFVTYDRSYLPGHH
jgi:histone H3